MGGTPNKERSATRLIGRRLSRTVFGGRFRGDWTCRVRRAFGVGRVDKSCARKRRTGCSVG